MNNVLSSISTPELMLPERLPLANIFDFSLDPLKRWCSEQGIEEFRADQIFQWLYRKGERNFEKMSNISKPLREKLSHLLSADLPEFTREQRSKDGTIKWAMTLPRGGEIETVYIPEENRGTLCISSQVGCCLACRFCATGRQGFQRNLRTSEIIGQVWRAAQILRQWKPIENATRAPITNIVFMGMGEPLLNAHHVFSVLQILLHPHGFGFSKRRVTVSTSGVVPAIYQLGRKIDTALAISLHAPNDPLRSELMPINQRYPLSELLEALKWYLKQSRANAGGLTVEYTLLSQVNDQVHHARELAQLFKGLAVKINLIPWNRIEGVHYEPSPPEAIAEFAAELKRQGLFSTQRRERGADISAACGQLVGQVSTMSVP